MAIIRAQNTGVAECKPIRQSELACVSERLNEQATRVGGLVTQLVERLDTVTRKEPKQEANDTACTPTPCTEAASRIDNSIRQLVRIEEQLQKQIELLEV